MRILLFSEFSRSSLTMLAKRQATNAAEKLRCCVVSLESLFPQVPCCQKKLLLHRIQAKGCDLSPADALMSAPVQVSLLTPLTPPIINGNYMFLSSPPTHSFQEKPFVPMHLKLILTSCILSTEPTLCPAASSQTPQMSFYPFWRSELVCLGACPK